MDSKEGTDGLTGEYTNEGSYIGKDGLKPYPSSDDSVAHNNMFGMQYTVSFTLSEEYVGPLEYYFFGDDDMWVFLDDQLVCDIGGVHSSVGEYVNLWDYLEKGSSGTHTLNFFYTERGLSGSSCYMQFTLPSVTSVTPGSTPGGLKISKTVESSDGGNINEDEEFAFTLNLKSAGGSSLTDKYPMVCYDQNGQQIESTSISNGDTFKLMHGQYVIINYLPVGAQYTVTEVYHDGYSVSHKINEGTITGGQTAAGSITSGKTDVVDYYNKVGYILPATGGIGTRCYTFGGLLLMMGSLMYGVARRRRKS